MGKRAEVAQRQRVGLTHMLPGVGLDEALEACAALNAGQRCGGWTEHGKAQGAAVRPQCGGEEVHAALAVLPVPGIGEADERELDEGRVAALLSQGYFVGVDIKKFSLDIGLINFKGDIVDLQMNLPYNFENTPEAMDTLCEMVKDFIRHVSEELSHKILNVCINISGRVNPEAGYSYSIFNFSERPLDEILTQKIGYQVSIDNDTRAMTYGEYLQGCVKGEKNILFINISWGLGMGIIINGRIYMGKSGFSGEIGHIQAFDNEVICHCGKKGCLETGASGSALHRIFIERIRNGESSILSKRVQEMNTPLTLDEIIRAINKEDPLGIEIVEEIGQRLGKHIAGLINIFNPEMVIIGGTLALTEDYILQPIKTAVRKYSLNMVNKDSVIVTSKLKEKAGVVGACMLARSRTFEY